nr:MAG TPA: hypothetical protein [Caudoviricetes sp.]
MVILLTNFVLCYYSCVHDKYFRLFSISSRKD